MIYGVTILVIFWCLALCWARRKLFSEYHMIPSGESPSACCVMFKTLAWTELTSTKIERPSPATVLYYILREAGCDMDAFVFMVDCGVITQQR